MDIRTCKVETSCTGPEWGKRIGPGQQVDLDEVIAKGVRVRDVFPAEFFDAAPVLSRRPQVTTDTEGEA